MLDIFLRFIRTSKKHKILDFKNKILKVKFTSEELLEFLNIR